MPIRELRIFNYSNVFGGQEVYAQALLREFALRKIYCKFVGGPEPLRCISSDSPCLISRFGAEIFNGNRALYLRAWRRRESDVRLYVQHSDVLDGQQSAIKRWIRRGLLRVLLTRMDAVIRVCDQALPDHYAPGKVYTVYNGVSLPASNVSPRPSRPFTLLMVGAVNDNKNQKLALQLLVQRADLHLVVVGDGPRRAEWQQWAVLQGVGPRVQWVGSVEEPGQFYAQADALLMLSHFEAFPFAVLEAMSHAMPVVGARVGGVPEAITHEHDGLLLPANTLPHLAEAVDRLKGDLNWCGVLGRAARDTVERRFTVEHMVDGVLRVIEAAAHKKRRGA